MSRLNFQSRGFTLIEVMLVLVLMAMMFTLTPPLMHKAFPALKLKAAARDLVQEIRFVQQSAIISGSESKISFQLQTDQYQSDLVNQGEVRQLPDGISFLAETSATRQQILVLHFYPDGSSSGGLIRLANKSRGFVITVDWLTSRVEILDSSEFNEDASFKV
ncbi:MAG: prepilin-type N-terminal cleavage/methylation domain-containing protein [Candidatus Thiodiazotropha taylori]|nr:prepilin-type N-terminal cleavage/methylation domain-containing protein [Candidatus Thiodiazotropha taylori]MCG7926302.1 prepilin-type N-terminal cleavage/methylation domain-containing protein [Candidatus Thiodiazotropha taylori]MCG7935966.1 prepilin-type N-terminal cleavage/methylation domain-containing protein [Candidatus Thiodiazotropha taylori]MCG7971723.1 prepilin-type N-terminal cleavage/methylation domain-containing protein [Candidatus Thiodiazotropha taylori]